MNLVKEIKKALPKGYSVTFDDTYVNIARPDGVHCEFYGNVTADETYVTATYTLNGKPKELDFHLPSETVEFVDTVLAILDS